MAWSHHWRNVWRNIAGSRPNWAQDFTRTSQKNSRSSQKNYYQHHRRITINILEILEPPIFAYHTYYTSKHMYNWMKWLRLLGGWHFIAATAIKPPKAACQFAADDILLYKFSYNIQWIYFTIWEKGKEELSPLQYHFKSLHIISSLYISYIGFTPSVRPSVRPSRLPCPLCNIYSSGWILSILATNDHYHERVCRTLWPLTLTYIFKVIWPWLRKLCPLCSV